MRHQRIGILCLAAVLALAAPVFAALDDDFKALAAYEWGQSDAAPRAIEAAIAAAAGNEAARKDLEGRLAALLQGPATRAAKEYACRKLALIGTKSSVPALAGLLPDKDLSHMARYALEAIPDASAVAALRAALPKTAAATRVGVINSLGVRRDAASVRPLAALLADPDAQIAAAAASALGRIGTVEASRALFAFRAKAPAGIRLPLTNACLEAAEGLARAGAKAEAARRFSELYAPDEPLQVRVGAFRGLNAVQPERAAGRAMAALKGDDPLWRAEAGEVVRAARNLKPYADALGSLPPAGQVVVLGILSERRDAAAHGAVLAAAKSPDESVRAAAIEALGALGTPADVPALVSAAAASGPESETARDALGRTRAPGADAAMVAAMQKAPAAKATVLGILTVRRAAGEMPAILRCAEDPDAGVRAAAVSAVGTLGGEAQAGDLVRLIQKADAGERAGIEKALTAVCGRAGAACASRLAPLAQSADGALRIAGLHALAACGGPDALAAVKVALADNDGTVQDEAVRTLSTWPNAWPDDAGVAEPLLALARPGQKPAHRILAIRGYLQYVQGDKKLGDADRVARIKELLPLIERPEEKRLAIAALAGVPDAGALDLLAGLAADPAVCEEACGAVLTLSAPEKKLPKEVRQKALQAVVERSKAAETRNKAADALKAMGQ